MKQKKIALYILAFIFISVGGYMISIPQRVSVPAPTIDARKIFTSAAKTVRVQINTTQTAAVLFPSATPNPTATHTPYPTDTIWRIEPISTLVDSYSYMEVYGVEDLPSEKRKDIQLSNEQRISFEERISQFLINEKTELLGEQISSSHKIYLTQAIATDLDHDGISEISLSYLIQSNGNMSSLIIGSGIAIQEGNIFFILPPKETEGFTHENILIPVKISKNITGLLSHITMVSGGSGIYPQIYRELFLWQDQTLKSVWKMYYFGGGRGGASNENFQNKKVSFSYLTGQPYKDIILSKEAKGHDFPMGYRGSRPENYTLYRVSFPGDLVFSWTGNRYELTHYKNDNDLIKIHNNGIIGYSPYVISSLLEYPDFSHARNQIEYYDEIGVGVPGRNMRGALIAWDENNLYARIIVRPDKAENHPLTISMGLDTDLEYDFEQEFLNDDDFLFKTKVFNPGSCDSMVAKTQMIYPRTNTIYTTVSPSSNPQYYCYVDIRIPLDRVNLESLREKKSGYILKYPLFSEENLHLYYPNLIKAIGFAIFSNSEARYASQALFTFDKNNPTTWGTLIFMADR